MDDVRRREWWVLVAACALAVVTIVVAWTATPLGLLQPSQGTATILPWFTVTSLVTAAVEAIALIVLGVAVRASGHRSGLPWRGLAAVAFAFLAWAFAGGFAVALQLWVAGGLGNPAPESAPGDVSRPLLIPLVYFWGGVALFGALVAAVAAAGVIWLRGWNLQRAAVVKRSEDYQESWPPFQMFQLYRDALSDGLLTDEQEDRKNRVARRLAWGQATDLAIPVVGWLVFAVGVMTGVAALLWWRTGDWLTGPGDLLLTVSSFLLAGAAAGFAWVAYRMYDTPALRQTVGILWDLGTFWPRATHPLAPPCYAERAVPELLDRVEFLLDHDVAADPPDAPPRRVVLSCHSQGSVIGAAVVSANRYATLRRLGFLTYGSPLGRLYARFFPTYFGERPLARVGELLAGGQTAKRETWPWVNLYRVSDPIGSYVFTRHTACESAVGVPVAFSGEVDWQLIDPRFPRADGDPAYPAALGHSDYWRDDSFTAALALVEKRRTAAVPGNPPW